MIEIVKRRFYFFMNGIYYRTIQRNEQTGETYFYISPLEPVSFAEDGLVKCYGIIGFYAYKMPIKLKGEYKDGIFLVDSESLPDDDRNDMEIVLNYVAQDDLTENQKNKILDFGNLFELADKNNAVDFFNNIKVDEKIAHRIIKKLQFLKAREKMTKFLLKENIPVDRIDFLISKNIGVPDIKASPYSIFALADMDIYHADVFAVKNCGMTAYSMQRLIGWISDTIRFSTDSGNCCISMESLERIVNARLKKSVFPETEVNIALLNFCLTEMGKKYCIKAVHEIPYVYENKIWDEENSIISDIHRLQNTPVEVCRKIFPDEIGKQERIIYTKGQRKCFDSLKTSGIKIITGPPGSGKTAVIKGLIRQYSQEIGGNIRLAATTGRAAQVLSKSTEMDAVTVNKLLDIRPFETAVPGKNINEPLNADLIIVDEVSMLGLELASFLLSAIKNQAVLILVGDKDQLPSVDYGNILADFIGCGLIETYYLTEVMRQHGTILDNSQLINHGSSALKQDKTFQVRNFCSMENAVEDIKKMHIDTDRVQYLSTVKKDNLGTHAINKYSQQNKTGKCIYYGKNRYFVGDRIIMTKTNYDRNYINGDVGIITDIREKSIIANFDGKILALDTQDFFYMDLAYCVTIHKSQGSEFDYVIVLLPNAANGMLTRRILYTAVTRAKKALIVYNVNHSMEHAISNQEERKRISLLTYRVKN